LTSGLVLADPIYERPMNTVVAGFMASPIMTFLRATISPDPGSMVDGGDGTVWPLQPDKSRGLARAIRRPSACGPGIAT
jgi:ABC-type sugar transport system ATPase subunit